MFVATRLGLAAQGHRSVERRPIGSANARLRKSLLQQLIESRSELGWPGQQAAAERQGHSRPADPGSAGGCQVGQFKRGVVDYRRRNFVGFRSRREDIGREPRNLVDRAEGVVDADVQILEIAVRLLGALGQSRRWRSLLGGTEDSSQATATDPEPAALVAQEITVAAEYPRRGLLRDGQARHAGACNDAYTRLTGKGADAAR
jgi:hypothetical protein